RLPPPRLLRACQRHRGVGAAWRREDATRCIGDFTRSVAQAWMFRAHPGRVAGAELAHVGASVSGSHKTRRADAEQLREGHKTDFAHEWFRRCRTDAIGICRARNTRAEAAV